MQIKASRLNCSIRTTIIIHYTAAGEIRRESRSGEISQMQSIKCRKKVSKISVLNRPLLLSGRKNQRDGKFKKIPGINNNKTVQHFTYKDSKQN
jgi:hypothetical protein